MLEINRRRSAIILARAMYRGRGKRLDIASQCFVGNSAFAFAPTLQRLSKIVFRRVANKSFGKIEWLDQKEPVIIGFSECSVRLGVHCRCGNNVNDDESIHAVWMIEG